MNIYKLKHADRETAIAELIAEGAYVENEDLTLSYGESVQAIVDIGIITLQYATYDDNFNELTPAIYAEGYHYDVMSTNQILFNNEILVNHPKHNFSGL
jgi:hypothetical protein